MGYQKYARKIPSKEPDYLGLILMGGLVAIVLFFLMAVGS